jgi:hypothetical protein
LQLAKAASNVGQETDVCYDSFEMLHLMSRYNGLQLKEHAQHLE